MVILCKTTELSTGHCRLCNLPPLRLDTDSCVCDHECDAAAPQRFKYACQFIAFIRDGGHRRPGDVKDQEPDKDHDSREDADQFYLDPKNKGKPCADEGDGGKISPEKVAGNPVRDEVLDPIGIQKVFDTEDDQHDRIEKGAKGYQGFQGPEKRPVFLARDPPAGITPRNDKGAAGKNGQLFDAVVPAADLFYPRINQQFKGDMTKKEQGEEKAAEEQHRCPDLFFQHERERSPDQKKAEKIDQHDLSWHGGREIRNEYGAKAPIIKLLPCQPDQTYGVEPAADFSKIFHPEAVFGESEYRKISPDQPVHVGSSWNKSGDPIWQVAKAGLIAPAQPCPCKLVGSHPENPSG